MTVTHTDKINKPLEQTVVMDSGSTLTALTSWETKQLETYLEIISPEKDVFVYFFERPITQSLKHMALEAWKSIHPQFDLEPSQDIALSVTHSWEEVHQFVYDTPTSESRFMAAITRSYKGNAYLCLVDATMAGLSRRSAELSLMHDSWLPVGFKEVSLNDHEVRDWTDEDIQDFEQFISKGMQSLNIPGLSIAIVKQDGQMLYKKGFGVKQVNSNDPVTPDTLFMIGSTTKPLTTLSMACLVDRKKLSWETPITDILPNFKLADSLLTQQLTIRHTVSASTGMPRRDLDWLFKYKGVTPEDRLLQMKDMKPTTALDETFQYSNCLVMAGGYAAARSYTSKGNLENAYYLAMHDLVFSPLKMTRTVLKTEEAMQLGAAIPHGFDFNGQLHEIPLHWEEAIYSVAPAGAVWSTVEDLSQYLLVEMNKGLLAGERIISEASLMERRKPGIKMGAKMSYGLGLIMMNEQGIDIIGHDGATLGFSSNVFFFPEKGIGFAALCNSRYAHLVLYAIRQKFMELTFSANPQSEEALDTALQAHKNLLKKNQQHITLFPQNVAWIEKLLGDYSSDTLGKLKLLKSAAGKGYEIELEEWSTRVGIETEPSGKQLLVLIDGPFPGLIRLIVDNNEGKFILDGGQEQHEFIRNPEYAEC